jgi:hypothetical protein
MTASFCHSHEKPSKICKKSTFKTLKKLKNPYKKIKKDNNFVVKKTE